ncbi:hypothetical protein CFK37_17585 [Virgibacillus phasianinus]|uniref:Lipoprotein n=1 Tax=Virgibacillus phasianinus TaxID=2017483 RepID=A0A220U6X0_9BACI|nr:DUF6612 family protein [Virgibacillus phasianinus]ASK63840.1 hypothetical protein CFK37_17585 [Virgibacillus phasianinus]
MRKIMVTAFAIVMIMVLAACGQTDSTNGSKDEANKEQQPKAEKKQEELTPQKVITKSSEAMQDWPGINYVTDGKQTITVTKGDQTQTIDQQFNIETKMMMDPIAMHMTGEMNMQGQKMPMESYYVDGKMYSKTPQNKWIAIEGMNLDQLQQQSQGQNPAESMKKFTKMLDELTGEDNSKEYITMKEKEDMYVVEMDLDEEASAKVMDMAMEQVKGSMKQLEQMGLGNVMEQMKFKSMKQTYYIDKESFEQKKMDQQMTIEMPVQDMNMKIDVDMTMDINGKVKEEITVPEDVKKNAQVVDMKQLQQAQQQTQTQTQP